MSSVFVENLEGNRAQVIETDTKHLAIKDLSILLKKAHRFDYSLLRAEEISKKYASATSILPFRVSFENIGIQSYGPNYPAPIGIAIIGMNNYIL